MPLSVKPYAISYPSRSPHRREWFTCIPEPDRNEPALHPSVWIMLAEDALGAGRIDQAEELIEEAYLAYEEAMTNVASTALGSDEEEPEFDSEQIGEPN
jgi:hypothetical protein